MAKDEKKIDAKSAKETLEKMDADTSRSVEETVKELFQGAKSVKEIVECATSPGSDTEAVERFLSLTDSITQHISLPEVFIILLFLKTFIIIIIIILYIPLYIQAKKLVDDIAHRNIYKHMFTKKVDNITFIHYVCKYALHAYIQLELSLVHSLKKKEGKTWIRDRQKLWKQKLEEDSGEVHVFVKVQLYIVMEHFSTK